MVSMITSPLRQNILGVKVSAVNMAMTLAWFEAQVSSRCPGYVCCAPAHAIMACVNDSAFYPVYNSSGLTTPDGMPIVWLLRWYGHRYVDRVYGPDLLLEVCRYGLNHGWRHFFYGGTAESNLKLRERLLRQYPDLVLAGAISPPFRNLTQEELDADKDQIRASHPDILWVGIGSPRQERWMAEMVDCLDVPVLVGVGAAFDFLSGIKPQAPYWIQRSGLEWLFRLASEPGRLWKRYILNYPRFVCLVLLQMLRLKKFGD